jgi:predicted RNase H-like HicB family nuclease
METIMPDHNASVPTTIPDQSFEFGSINPPPFEGPPKLSLVQSVVMPFAMVKPFLSGKPLRRARYFKPLTRKCLVYLIPEVEGGFSVVAADLPGVASQGETEEEALLNIREAFGSAIRCYRQDGKSIPWLDTPEEPEPGSITRSVIVHG